MVEQPTRRAFDLRLRDVIEADLITFFEDQRDPEAAQMAAFRSRDLPAFTAHWKKVLADVTILKQTILVDGQVAGNVVKFEVDGKPEVGYWIGKSYWGQGIASRALGVFLEQVAERPLYAHVARHNLASLRVLEKCGFAQCGEDDEGIMLKR